MIWRDRFFRYGPWVAVALIFWREQTLEEAITEFVTVANATIQKAIDGLDDRLREAVENAIETGRGSG